MQSSFSAQLSQVLVAFTIELDNEFEHQMPHRTTDGGLRGAAVRGPWLTSFAMYCNCLRFLGDGPMTIDELRARARMSTNVDGMRRWGYVALSPGPDAKSKKPNDRWLMELTRAGMLARKVREPLPAVIEQRWRERFGAEQVDRLRAILLELNRGLDVAYPDFLPILHHGLWTRGDGRGEERPLPPLTEDPLTNETPLTALLARLLCAFAYEFERKSMFSLAISANLLRVLDAEETRNRDLPRMTGLSKESISSAMGILSRANLVESGTGAAKGVWLNAAGLATRKFAMELITETERRWGTRFGEEIVRELREVLREFAGDENGLRLLRRLTTYPESWRAKKPKATVLPWFPMVLHRGGFPDGS